MSHHTDEEWARSLIGRDWEIFWDSGEEKAGDEKDQGSAAGIPAAESVVEVDPSDTQPTASATRRSGVVAASGDEANKGDAIGSEEPSDWYDGRIVSAKKCYDGRFLFFVTFVGDEQIYDMVLGRALVRPSARAWLRRTIALLLPKGGFDLFQSTLPADTMTLDDVPELLRLKESLDMDSALSYTETNGHLKDNESIPRPSRYDLKKIKFLLFQIRAQVYLRQKLALITDHGDRGDDDPTEAYVRHLVACLEQLGQMCTWYEECFLIHQQVFGSGDTSAAMINVETIRQTCVEHGREQLIHLVAMDVTHGGAKAEKRKPLSSPPGIRKTKRRRTQKDPGYMPSAGATAHNESNDGELFSLVNEGEFISDKYIQNFTKTVVRDDSRWFQLLFAGMLCSTSLYIQQPILKWTRQAEAVLGDRKLVADELNETEPGIEMGSSNDENDSVSAVSEDEEHETFYSFDDIQDCHLTFLNHQLLRQFDLSSLVARLEEKLKAIERFESQSWKLISCLVQEPEVGSLKANDEILIGLKELKDAAQNSDRYLLNVDPLGSSSSCKINREVLNDAIALREWVVDLRHSENFRERVSFVQDVVSRAPSLPHVPSPPNSSDGEDSVPTRLSKVMADVQKVSSNLYAHLHVFNRLERLVGESSVSAADPENLRSKEGVSRAFDQLKSIPVLSTVEEKLAVRLDIMNWRTRADSQLLAPPYAYHTVEELYEDLSKILAGENQNRSDLLRNLESCNVVDKEIRAFAAADATLLAEVAVKQVQDLYIKSSEWKKRADAIISALKTHGNPLAGAPIPSTKAAAMVDLKRIDDLLLEYPTLKIVLLTQQEILIRVQSDAREWSCRISDVIHGKNNLYANLVSERERRPKGLVMEPARHVVDSWVEALDWNIRVTEALRLFSAGDAELSRLYPLIIEGMEAVVAYSSSRECSHLTEFKVNTEICTVLVTGVMDSHRQIRHLSKEKMEVSELGKKLFSRLIADENNDFSLLCLVFVTWRIAVLDLFERSNIMVAEKGSVRPTLVEAKDLLKAQPCVPDNVGDVEKSLFFRVTKAGLTSEVESYKTMIADAEQTETTARTLLSRTKDLIRGSFNHADSLKKHFLSLKEVQANFKARTQAGPGLVLSLELEQQLDHCIKDLSWLVKTLSYPVLHSDNADLGSLTKATTLPWDVLLTLYERIPVSADDGNPTDIARVALRVREIHDSANIWQEEVTALLALSIRGAKRRAPLPLNASEPENQEKIDLTKLAELARNPILNMVAMPRESAVREVLEKAHAFEIELHNMLGEDFTLSATDRAPYPDSDSLVGENGDFHMYRLTGSPLFKELLNATKRIEKIADDICADMPGISAFDWIKRAVLWVESLNESVHSDSSFGGVNTLSIPAKNASQLILDGNTLFLDDISDDVRKTLSAHRIFLSTNKQTNKLTVLVGKGGAHHSMGGTCIKWCPLLHEWLKEDLTRMLDWEGRVALHAQSLGILHEETKDDEVLYQRYRFLEDTERLIDEGRTSLIVTPQKILVDGLLGLKTSIGRQIEASIQTLNGTITIEALKRRRYEDSFLAVDERDDLLLDLLNRRRLQPRGRVPVSGLSEDGTYRDKARSILEKALNKGMKMMGINQLNSTDVALWCTLKAFELECAVFAENDDSQGDYRDKVRSLRSNMEDVKNPTLAARYLLSEVSAESLVSMSPDEMASKHVREMKAAADAESKRNIILARAQPTDSNGKGGVKNILKAAMRSFSEVSPHAQVIRSETPPPDEVDLMAQDLPAAKARLKTPSSLVSAPSGSFSLAGSDDSECGTGVPQIFSPSSATSSPNPSQTRLRSLNAMPPPPPSLGMVPLASSVSTSAHVRQGLVISDCGSDKFSFTINRNTFRANLVYEGDSTSDIRHGFLPANFVEKGRLSIPEFQKFLAQKIDGGRWTVVTLRLSVISESEAYKGFYKEYETKKRIVMFGVGKETKMFLVTPRFHRDTRSLRGQFTNTTSTYAIVLTREQFFE
jgi:hypothetical protein